MIMNVGVLLAISLVLLYFYLTKNYGYWKKRGVAWEKPSLIFGNLFEGFTGKIPVGLIHTNMYQNHPSEKVVGWFKMRQPALLIRDPALIRQILLNDFTYFRNNDAEIDPEHDPIFGRNLFVLKDDIWKKNRALLTPAFTPGKIKGICSAMREVAKEFVKYLKKHPEELNVKSTMSRYTAEVAARCGLGVEGNNFNDSKDDMFKMGLEIFQSGRWNILKFTVIQLLPDLAKHLGLKLVSDKVLAFFDTVLRDVIVYRQEKNEIRMDFVQFLLDIKKKSEQVANGTLESSILPSVYTNDDVLSGCIMFFIESFETTALSLTHILYLLAKNKHVQEKLRQEVDGALNEGELTYEKLNQLSYLNCVVLETGRLLPVFFTLNKICTERYEMDVGKSIPLVIEKGTPITLPVYAIQNDPAYWEEPESFMPERFANKEDAEAKANGIFLPFGEGPRMCPGYRIATAVMKVALVSILAELEVFPTGKTPDKIDYDPNYFLLSNKGGIHLRFAERSF
ncbi:hypothetical protein RUM44_014015 [Polyplax serrata]|uniref:Cytochrome P450 n=1 Tax=Polyplax serrata TaxID=468196 RepID=A0ABR1BG27_POLSC